jgi:hypothetical protein
MVRAEAGGGRCRDSAGKEMAGEEIHKATEGRIIRDRRRRISYEHGFLL